MCMACKFFTCPYLRKKGIKFKPKDFLIMKYLYSWKQKIIALICFFTPEEEVLKYIYKNSIIYWWLKFRLKKYVKREE